MNYRKIWEQAHGKIPEGKHIHHIDGNSTNNSVDNLICVSREMHREIHLQDYNATGNNKDAWAYMRLGGKNPIGVEPWNKGLKLSEAHKQILSKVKLDHTYNRIGCVIDGIKYKSYGSAARALGVAVNTVRSRVKNSKYTKYNLN